MSRVLAAALGLLALGLGLALGAQDARALEALPDAARLGPTEGTVVVRTQGPLRVWADAPIEAALPGGPFVQAPVVLEPRGVPPWHGLEGAFELRLRRADAGADVQIELDDGTTGVLVEWPAVRESPGPGAWAVPLVGAGMAVGRAGRLRRGRS